MAGQECEALRILFQKHLAQIAVAETDLAAVRYGTGDAECLKADTDRCSSFGSLAAVLLDGDGSAYRIGPLCIFKADRLNAFNQFVDVQTGRFRDLFTFFDGRDAILLKYSKNLRLSSFIRFK